MVHPQQIGPFRFRLSVYIIFYEGAGGGGWRCGEEGGRLDWRQSHDFDILDNLDDKVDQDKTVSLSVTRHIPASSQLYIARS